MQAGLEELKGYLFIILSRGPWIMTSVGPAIGSAEVLSGAGQKTQMYLSANQNCMVGKVPRL